MLLRYIQAALEQAHYEMLEDEDPSIRPIPGKKFGKCAIRSFTSMPLKIYWPCYRMLSNIPRNCSRARNKCARTRASSARFEESAHALPNAD